MAPTPPVTLNLIYGACQCSLRRPVKRTLDSWYEFVEIFHDKTSKWYDIWR